MYCFEAEVRLLGVKDRRQVRCGSEGEASGCMAGLRGVTGPGLHRLSCHHGRHLWCYTSCLGSVVVPCLAALGDLTCNKRATLNTMFVCLFVCLLAFLIAAGWQLVRVHGHVQVVWPGFVLCLRHLCLELCVRAHVCALAFPRHDTCTQEMDCNQDLDWSGSLSLICQLVADTAVGRLSGSWLLIWRFVMCWRVL